MAKNDRRYIRFLAEENAFAVLGDDYSKVGKIKDISFGGLSFDYLNNDQPTSKGRSKISIFTVNDGFHLADVDCTVICDCQADEIGQKLFGELHKTKCTVEFLSLSDNQKKLLDHFLKCHTTGLSL
jgi:hypothetical protein